METTTHNVAHPVVDANIHRPVTQHLRPSFHADLQDTYERRRAQERGILRREMDQKACRESLWLALYTSELCEWPGVTASIFEMIATVDALRHAEGAVER